MRNEALFINGVFEEVLADILAIQGTLPEQILYLQPYSPQRIVKLYEWQPCPEEPVAVYMSTTDNLGTVAYGAEIVGVRDKTALPPSVETVISQIIAAFQPTEKGIYKTARGMECRNLLSIWRLKRLSHPFDVTDLRLLETSEPAAGARSTAGGWWYVFRRDAV